MNKFEALLKKGIAEIYTTKAPVVEGFGIVNNSSVSVEMYYEIDKEEYGNTIVNSGSSATISINQQYPYYLRYSSNASGNTQIFNGVYKGSSYNGSVGYYDWNIQPPNAVGSDTRWVFYEGDCGTLTISGSSEPTRVVTYDGENQIGYGENAESPIQYEGGQE